MKRTSAAVLLLAALSLTCGCGIAPADSTPSEPVQPTQLAANAEDLGIQCFDEMNGILPEDAEPEGRAAKLGSVRGGERSSGDGTFVTLLVDTPDGQVAYNCVFPAKKSDTGSYFLGQSSPLSEADFGDYMTGVLPKSPGSAE